VTRVKLAALEHLDWNALRDELSRLGAIGFHLDKLADGTYRVGFLLPTGHPERALRIEAVAATEAEAIRLALDRATGGPEAKN
jgi:hypothetical protein